jgi:hypothetical protein
VVEWVLPARPCCLCAPALPIRDMSRFFVDSVRRDRAAALRGVALQLADDPVDRRLEVGSSNHPVPECVTECGGPVEGLALEASLNEYVHDPVCIGDERADCVSHAQSCWWRHWLAANSVCHASSSNQQQHHQRRAPAAGTWAAEWWHDGKLPLNCAVCRFDCRLFVGGRVHDLHLVLPIAARPAAPRLSATAPSYAQ